MPSKEKVLAQPPIKQLISEKDYIDLETELVQFKEKAYRKLQQYQQIFELFEEEMEIKQELVKQLTSAQETISELEQKIIQLHDTYRKNEKELRALKKSKLGRLTVKYWAFRKRFTLRRIFSRG